MADGPFTGAGAVVGGYWMIQTASREEAIGWARRAPMSDNEIIEVRQVQELAEFPEEIRKIAAKLPEMQSQPPAH